MSRDRRAGIFELIGDYDDFEVCFRASWSVELERPGVIVDESKNFHGEKIIQRRSSFALDIHSLTRCACEIRSEPPNALA